MTQNLSEISLHISKEKEKLDIIVESIGEGVFVLDENREIALVNKMTEQLSKYSREELLGKRYHALLPFVKENEYTAKTAFIEAVYDTGEIQYLDDRSVLIQKGGSRLAVADSAAPILDENGKTVACVVVFRDVSKERELDSMKYNFVSIASHQLRTPLTGMKWFANILLREKAGPLNDKQKEFVTKIIYNNDRLINLVEDLLNITHIENESLATMETANVNVYELLNDTISNDLAAASSKRIAINLKDETNKKATINCNKEKISLALSNIIDNAIKYTNEKGIIDVGIKIESDNVIIYISDDGIGIPKEQHEEVFERFFRGDNAVSLQTYGTGLGLNLVKSIIEAHQGKIWFESEEGKGTTFYIALFNTEE